MAYLFRARDRRLMKQTERDIALTLQRDYRSFNVQKTTELSNRVPIYTGYLSTGGNAFPNISWSPGSQVDAAFTTLEQLLTQLKAGKYQTWPGGGTKNPGIWPVETVNWQWIRSLYAYINPAYAAWLTANSITVPSWTSAP
jgi:hypothetical protein